MFQAPKRFSKPPEGTVGAAPLSCPLELAVIRSGWALASCFGAAGLAALAVALAVLVSAVRGVLAALGAAFAVAARFGLDADASAGCVVREAPA